MGAAWQLRAAEVAAAALAVALFLIPLARLTQLSYDRRWWWSWNEVDVLPFPARFTLRSPLWAWCLAFWMIAVHALATAVGGGTAATLAVIAAGVECAYAVLNWRRRATPVDRSAPRSLLAFGLWHNAVLEELLFRGIPLSIGMIAGISTRAFWPWIYIPISALAFGLHHLRMGRRARVVDTTIYGAVLAAVALRYGLPAAILLHAIHNACSLPLGHTGPSLRPWLRNRRIYVAALTLAGLLSLVPGRAP